jgi:regulator of protease activity HflC (stomatin/prohibitin superfamily)
METSSSLSLQLNSQTFEVSNMGTYIVIGFLVFMAFLLLRSVIRIVPEYQRLVLFTLGRCDGQKGPGLVFVVPVVQSAVGVDLRESFLEVAHQTCITKDNAPIGIDFLLYWKVMDPVLTVVTVRDFSGAAQGIAMTTLRAVVGDIPLDDVLARRDQINQVLRTKLDEVTERWGVKITNVEIREINPPRDIQDSMNKQMSAERSRRAMVLEADGQKSAAITVAEGQKQSEILKAEGARQAVILGAEAKRQASILEAEGNAMALKTIFDQAKGIDSNTLSLQYLETLKSIGASPSSKWIIPAELTGLVQKIGQNLTK